MTVAPASSGATGSFRSLAAEEPFDGVRRRGFSTAQATVSRYTFEPGAAFPLHRHPQEQITLVEKGSVTMAIGGKRIRLASGDWSVVGPGVEHGIVAGGDGATVVALVAPARRNADAYQLSGENAR